jgi:uncharacterized membrane protein YcaP (DUF421 family)
MADLRLFRRRTFAATGFVAFAISATARITRCSGGLLGAALLLAANYTTVRLGFQHPALARALEGTPTTLVQDGKMLDDNLRR